jgi:hypothetical protein
MRTKTLALAGAVGLGISIASVNAAPMVPAPLSAESSKIIQVAQGCGAGLHRSYRGYCVRAHHPYANYRHYYRFRPYYGHYRTYPYYGGGYEPWNRPSPSDHVANWLNAQEARRGWNYWGY